MQQSLKSHRLAAGQRPKAFSGITHICRPSTSTVQQSVAPSARVVATRAKLGETSLFGGSTSSLMGGSPKVTSDADVAAAPKQTIEDVALESEVGERRSNWLVASSVQRGLRRRTPREFPMQHGSSGTNECCGPLSLSLTHNNLRKSNRACPLSGRHGFHRAARHPQGRRLPSC